VTSGDADTFTERLAILTAVVIGGGVLMSLEILAFRIIGRTFGSALRETSVIIAIFLTAMSCGYYAGGRLVDRFPFLRTMAAVLAMAAATTVVVPSLDRVISPIVFASTIPLALHAAVVTTSIFFIPTFCLATLSPIGIRLLVSRLDRSGTTAGSISALSTIGSIFGSVGTAFVLIDLFRSVDRTIYVLAAVSLALAILVLMSARIDALVARRFASRGARRMVAAVVLLVGALVVANVVLYLRAGPARITGQEQFGVVEVFNRDSTYHHIIVRDHMRMRTLLFDGLAQTRMALADPLEGGFAYTDFFHVPMLFEPRMERALFIGVGGGTGPKLFAAHYPAMKVDAVDVDPLVLDVARDHFALKPDNRLKLHAADGRAFLNRHDALYDVIVVDAYTMNRYGASIPPHLTTREFFLECRRRLKPGGFVLFNCFTSPETPIARVLAKTLFTVFPHQLAFVTPARTNTVFVASERDLRITREELARRVEAALASGAMKLDEARLAPPALVLREPELLGVSVLTDDYAPVDRLLRESDR
jgi:spermidine synthase